MVPYKKHERRNGKWNGVKEDGWEEVKNRKKKVAFLIPYPWENYSLLLGQQCAIQSKQRILGIPLFVEEPTPDSLKTSLNFLLSAILRIKGTGKN